jgi:hypothetical protein
MKAHARAATRRAEAMLQEALADGVAAGEITTDAAGCTVVPADFFSKITDQMNAGKSIGARGALDKLVDED